MCGIAGSVHFKSLQTSKAYDDLKRMLGRLAHRGPDDEGIWSDFERGVHLGQRRLSIIDLSAHGHQPMVSPDGRWVIVFNGEIYNFASLRSAVEAGSLQVNWRGESDTEIFLACIQNWGIRQALTHAVGMFAFAVWDREKSELTIARDRMGEKPLYYGRIGDQLVFASELKAFQAVHHGRLHLDPSAIASFMRFSYIPSPKTIWTELKKLPPGRFLTVRSLNCANSEPEIYWDLEGENNNDLANELTRSSDEKIISRLDALMLESVGGQMVSDVPLGAFLSGGVDSSLIVALMQAQSSRPVRTFTIGFNETQFDEAPYAREVARHLGTDHTELYVDAQDALGVIPELPAIFDEPFADSSQIPTILLARLTRKSVTVALSGDGGDELFAGYPRYELGATFWRKFGTLPIAIRRMLALSFSLPSAGTWDRLLNELSSSWRGDMTGQRLHKLTRLLRATTSEEMYLSLVTACEPENVPILGAEKALNEYSWLPDKSLMYSMRRWDIHQYLPDDLLAKIDRAAMSESLETRAPFLDHRVVRFAFAMPENSLIRGREKKWALKQLLSRYLPRELFDRPKKGFSTPIAAWLRGPLREWAESLICRERLIDQGILNYRHVAKLWDEHQLKAFDHSSILWNILMFQAWHEANVNASQAFER
jgi:asparagine synthase (glutamine-hydrolysing)